MCCLFLNVGNDFAVLLAGHAVLEYIARSVVDRLEFLIEVLLDFPLLFLVGLVNLLLVHSWLFDYRMQHSALCGK